MAVFNEILILEHKASLVAHLAYHLNLRCGSLPICSFQQLLWSMAESVKSSMISIDELAEKLGICQPGSEMGNLWSRAKHLLSRYLATGDTGSDRHTICSVFESLDIGVKKELTGVGILPPLVHVVGYVQNIGAVIALIVGGDCIPRKNAEIYVTTTVRLLPFSFSEEYMGVQKTATQLVRRCLGSGLREGDLERIYELNVWLANNVLTHFHPHAHELENMASALFVLSSQLATEGTTTELETPEVEPSALSIVDSESEGEEKADVSEKNERDELEKHESEELLPTTNCGDVAAVHRNREEVDHDHDQHRTVHQILSSVLSADDFPDDVSNALSSLDSPDDIYQAEMEIESRLRTLTARTGEIEEEIHQLEGCCSDATPGVVLQTLSKALCDKKCSLEAVLVQISRLGKLRERIRTRSGTRRQLNDLRSEEMRQSLGVTLRHCRDSPCTLLYMAKKVVVFLCL